MADRRKVNSYFKARKKVKEKMCYMLQPKQKWTKKVISEFEVIFKDYKKKYAEHEQLCKNRGG